MHANISDRRQINFETLFNAEDRCENVRVLVKKVESGGCSFCRRCSLISYGDPQSPCGYTCACTGEICDLAFVNFSAKPLKICEARIDL